MPYKISGTKSETARIIILKESDWNIESETVVSGSGAYEISELASGNKTVVARSNEGETLGYGDVTPTYFYNVGDRGIFAGRDSYYGIEYITISTTGNSTSFGNLSVITKTMGATSNGITGRGIFVGGKNWGGVIINNIEYITISTSSNSIDFGDLSAATAYKVSTSNGTNDRGVFAGGIGGGVSDTIDYLTISSTGNTTPFGDLAYPVVNNAATSNGTNNRGIFSGGSRWGTNPTNTIEYITITSTSNATNFGDLVADNRWVHASISNLTNNRGLFLGGVFDGYTNNIEYVTISSTSNSYDFGDLINAKGGFPGTSNGTNERGVVGATSGTILEYVTISSTGNATTFGNLLTGNQEGGATSDA